MHDFDLPKGDTNKPKDPSESFWQWLKDHTLVFYSQIAALFGVLGFFASLIYYLTHGEFFTLLNPQTIQNFIFWIHLPILFIFILWSIHIKNEAIDDTVAKKAFRIICRGEIKPKSIGQSKERLNIFINRYLAFWIMMFLLYCAFTVQKTMVTPREEKLGVETLLSLKPEIKSYFEDKERGKNDSQHLSETMTELKKSLDENDSINETSQLINTYSKIQDFRDGKDSDGVLKNQITEIVYQLKNPEILKSLEHITETNKLSNRQGSNVNLTYLRFDNIYQKVLKALEISDSEQQRQLIKEAARDAAAADIEINKSENDQKLLDKIKNIDSADTAHFISEIDKEILILESYDNILPDKKDSIQTWRKYYKQILLSTFTYIFNNLSWFMIFACFLTMAVYDVKPDKKEKKYFWYSIGVIAAIISAFPAYLLVRLFTGAGEIAIMQSIIFFDGFSGMANAIALSLLIAKLDSKLVGLNSRLIFILYIYAAIQPMYVVFEQPGAISQIIKTIVLVVVFFSKIYFFLIITFAIQQGGLLTYFYCFPTISKRAENVFNNRFEITLNERATDTDITITRDNQPVYKGNYPLPNARQFRNEIYKMQDLLLIEEQNLLEEEGEKKYIKIIPTSLDHFQIEIHDEDNKIICRSKNESLTRLEADNLRSESIRFLSHCDVKIINEDRKVITNDL